MIKHSFIFLVCIVWAPVTLATSQPHTGFFDQMFEKHALIMMLIDPDKGDILAANKAASEFYGYSRDALAQMNIAEINDLSPLAAAEERKLAALEKRRYFVFRHRLADGSTRTVQVSSIPVSYRGSTVLFSIITDISELRATQESLWHYQNRLEQMVDEQTQQLEKRTDQQLIATSLVILFLGVVLTTMWLVLRKKRRTEYELQLERGRLDEIIRGTHVGTWEWHVPSGQLVVNDRWTDIIGYSQKALSPITIATWESLCHSETMNVSSECFIKRGSGSGYYRKAR